MVSIRAATSGKAGQRGRKRRRFVPLLVAVTLFIPAEGALAADSRKDCDSASAVDQYKECLPTSSGSKSAGRGGGDRGVLAPSVATVLHRTGGRKAAWLEKIATSPAYGGPSGALARNRGVVDIPGADGSASARGALAGAARAVGAGEGRLIALLVALVLVSFSTLALAGSRYRQSKA